MSLEIAVFFVTATLTALIGFFGSFIAYEHDDRWYAICDSVGYFLGGILIAAIGFLVLILAQMVYYAIWTIVAAF